MKIRQQMNSTPPRAVKAFTLIELIVVVAILAIVAALIIPRLPALQRQANNVGWLSNLTEVDRLMLSYNASTGGMFPDGYDSLVDSTNALYSGLPGGPTGSLSTTLLTATNLQSYQVTRLNKIGITTVQIMKTTSTSGFGATYFAYSSVGATGSNPQLISTSTYLPFLKSTNLQAGGMKYNLDSTHSYCVLGIGQACSLVGPAGWIKDAPVVKNADGALNPTTAYCRPCILIDLGPVYSGGRADSFVPTYVGSIGLAADYFYFTDEMVNIPNSM